LEDDETNTGVSSCFLFFLFVGVVAWWPASTSTSTITVILNRSNLKYGDIIMLVFKTKTKNKLSIYKGFNIEFCCSQDFLSNIIIRERGY
jgi:hypothetical protein